ncbi:MAG TPA: hypothetical protein VLV54_22665 [Thermoanaerobaculia bacterium]|nr:hypothetical protein [Thermoanaerobaculia bacterium]
MAVAADSNPALLSEDLSLNVPSANRTLRGEVADRAADLDVRLGAYPFWRPAGRSSQLGVTFEGSQSLYHQLKFLNLSDLRAVVHLAWGRTPLGYLSGPLGWTRVPNGTSSVAFLMQGGYTAHLLDGKSYLQVLTGSGAVRWRETRSMATQVDLEVRDLHFAEEPAAGRRSGQEARLGASQYLYLGREDRYLRVEALAGDRRAGRPFTGSLWRGGAELALPLTERWSLYLAGTRQKEDFNYPESDLFAHFSPFDPEFQPGVRGTPRRDTVTRAAAALSWSWEPVQVTARFTYISRDSSLGSTEAPNAFDYNRTITSLGLTWSF